MILHKHNVKRQGFTLVELIVVLMILVGLAAVLIPAVTDMVARTNASTRSANIAEVSNAIQRYEAQYLSYPDNLDSLMSDVTTPTVLDTLETGLTTNIVVNVQLTAALRAPLTEAGITSVAEHTAGDDTFELGTTTALADDDYLLGLTVAAQQALGLETTGVLNKYVVLGVGALSEMNGKTCIDAPVYFPESGDFNPDVIYGRFIAIFQITDGTDPLERARFVGVMTPTGEGLNAGMADYFEIVTSN